MPRYTRKRTMRRTSTKRKKLRGGSFKKWIKKVGSFLKKHKVLSKGAAMMGPRGAKAANVLNQLGLGCGGSLRLAGGSLGPVGGRYRRRVVRRRRR